MVAKTPPKLPWVNLHPQWDQGKNPKNSFKLFLNITNNILQLD
jgi:hypothetical protein